LGENETNIIVVDDDDDLLETMKDVLSEWKYNTVISNDGKKAMDMFIKKRFKIAILDVNMPVMNGFDVYTRIKKFSPSTRCFFMTGEDKGEIVGKIRKENGIIFQKPVNLDALHNEMRKFLNRRNDRRS
jgi:DNA-binding response OmpR family regulator